MGHGGGCIGVKPGTSPYISHNWCSHCEKWILGKPLRCPDCNYRTRGRAYYN